MDIFRNSLEALEWPAFLDYYRSFCSSVVAQNRALELNPATERGAAELLQSHTLEAISLLALHSYASLENLPDLEAAFQRLQKGACLSGIELAGIAKLILVIDDVRAAIGAKAAKDAAPGLALSLSRLASYREESAKLKFALDDEGQVRDSASPKLGKLRREERRVHEDARRETDRLLKQAHKDGYAQDLFIDVRDGRYVIPIKREHRGQVPGLIFESSQSRATVFVEPSALREPNDRIRQIQIEIEEEIFQILRELSDQLMPRANDLALDSELLLDFDLTLARGKIARDLDNFQHASPVAFSDRTELFRLFHPLLRRHIAADQVVSSDFCPGDRTRIILISGPNTGGKTVFLKAVGLASLMARAGFLLPTNQPGQIPFYRRVLAHIGDEQSIAMSLSSFSSSIVIVKQILEEAGEDTLVLIDEILSSTDPREAAALSAAILKELAARGCFAIVTTHIGDLKELASSDPLFENASMEFDPVAMLPKYRLRLGAPGRSWAIETAARLGLPESIIKDANARVGTEHLKVESLLAKIESREKELESFKEEQNQKSKVLELQITKLGDEKQLLAEERRRIRDEFRLELRRREQDAEAALEKALELLRIEFELEPKERTSNRILKRQIGEVKKSVDEIIDKFEAEVLADVEAEGEASPAIPLSASTQLTPGTRVRIISKGIEGVVNEAPAANSRWVEIRAGILKVKVDLADLAVLSDAKKNYAGPRRSSGSTPLPAECPPELNLLGLRADEALGKLESYLDQAAQSGRASVRIVHGHGTGALKKAVREFLKKNPYGAKFRSGAANEGGDGCTVVEFRDV